MQAICQTRQSVPGLKQVLIAVLLSLGSAGVFAQDSMDGQIGLDWWNLDSASADESFDVADLNGFAEVWWGNNWGVKGQIYRSDLNDSVFDESDHLSIDLKRRFYSMSDNNFIAVGAGWEEIDLEDGSSSGIRLTAEGRVGLGGVFSLYGLTSWLPELDDTGTRTNLKGQAFEAGLHYDPAPYLSLRLGFRRFKLDYDEGAGSGSAESDGFIFGAGFHW